DFPRHSYPRGHSALESPLKHPREWSKGLVEPEHSGTPPDGAPVGRRSLPVCAPAPLPPPGEIPGVPPLRVSDLRVRPFFLGLHGGGLQSGISRGGAEPALGLTRGRLCCLWARQPASSELLLCVRNRNCWCRGPNATGAQSCFDCLRRSCRPNWALGAPRSG